MILNLSKVRYGIKIINSNEQLILQTILLTGMMIIGLIFSFFLYKMDDTINAHNAGVERTLVIREVVIKDKTFSDFINDIESIEAVESVTYKSHEDDLQISILMTDYRDRSAVIQSLPEYVVSVSIFTHKIEGLFSKIKKVKFFGVFAMILLMLIYSFFYIGMFDQIAKVQFKTMKVLTILGYNVKERLKIIQLPLIFTLVFSNIVALIINTMFVSPIINTAIRNIGFLESLGVGYQNRWMDFVVITFFVIIINGIIIGCYTVLHQIYMKT